MAEGELLAVTRPGLLPESAMEWEIQQEERQIAVHQQVRHKHSSGLRSNCWIRMRNSPSNLQKLLPAGTTPQQACSGFSNLGHCVAAIHVSQNLGISFSDLKGKITGSNSESLGKAIHELKPDVDANAEKKKAEKQAKDDMNGSAN
jgi:hypothetical protein